MAHEACSAEPQGLPPPVPAKKKQRPSSALGHALKTLTGRWRSDPSSSRPDAQSASRPGNADAPASGPAEQPTTTPAASTAASRQSSAATATSIPFHAASKLPKGGSWLASLTRRWSEPGGSSPPTPSSPFSPTASAAAAAPSSSSCSKPAAAPPSSVSLRNRAASDASIATIASADSSARGGSAACPTSVVAIAHQRVRHDLSSLGKALERMLAQVQDTNPLAEWQVDSLKTCFRVTYTLARCVHRHQEETLFPLFNSQHTKVCDELRCQNTDCALLWSSVRTRVFALRLTQDPAADLEALRELLPGYRQLAATVKAHLADIETKLLPVVHQECSAEEVQRLDAKLLPDPSLQDWAHFLSLQADPKAKKAVLQYMGASKLTQTMLSMQGYSDYAKNVAPLFQDLRDGCPGIGQRKSSIGSGGGGGLFGGSGGMGVYL